MKRVIFRAFGFIAALALFTSCTKAPGNGSIHKVESFYSSAKIEGETVSFTENKDGYLNGYGKGGAFVPALGKYMERQSTTFAKNGENVFNIYFLKFVDNNPPTKEDIKSVFRLGNYQFGNSSQFAIKEGIEIAYVDENGTEWNTRGDQTGSFFEVTDHALNTLDSYTPYTTSGKFSCRLYNQMGESMAVTDGTFKGRTVVYY